MRLSDDMLSRLPGGDIIRQGYIDIAGGACTEAAMLVSIASPRLRSLGFDVPRIDCEEPVEHALYTLIEARDPLGAHAEYNALIGRIVSFEDALDSL
jgi:hypothetical protein